MLKKFKEALWSSFNIKKTALPGGLPVMMDT
jgi:hypothetical protein